MTRSLTPTLWLMAVLAGLSAATAGRAEPGSPPPARPGVPNRAARLEALDPARPIGYFELAEEIAYEKTNDTDTKLARELFVLAHELDRRAGSPSSLGPSVCLALRDLSTNADEKSWLAAMGGLNGASAAATPDAPAHSARPAPDSSVASASREPSAEAILLATIHFAAQEPRAAQDLLRRADVASNLLPMRERHHILARVADESAAVTVCPECRNRRVASSSIDSAAPARPCPTCGGNPGPRLNEREYLALVRLQAELAGVRPATWSADLLLSGAAPIRDADPGALATYFGVDPRKTKWRHTTTGAGEWYNPDQP